MELQVIHYFLAVVQEKRLVAQPNNCMYHNQHYLSN